MAFFRLIFHFAGWFSCFGGLRFQLKIHLSRCSISIRHVILSHFADNSLINFFSHCERLEYVSVWLLLVCPFPRVSTDPSYDDGFAADLMTFAALNFGEKSFLAHILRSEKLPRWYREVNWTFHALSVRFILFYFKLLWNTAMISFIACFASNVFHEISFLSSLEIKSLA